MPRPQLGIGEYGHISATREGKTWMALARYRDLDGETRRVKATGKSKSGAEAALREKLAQRSNRGQGPDISAESRVTELAEAYYTAKLSDDLAPNTYYNMRRAIDNHIITRMGKQRIREVTPQRIQNVVTAVTQENGPGTAMVVRNTISGMFKLAARWGAVGNNPVAFTERPKLEEKPIRALTLDELLAMRKYAATVFQPFTPEERLVRAGGDRSKMGGKNRNPVTLDVIDFLLGTGARAAEPAGLYWEDVHLDSPVPWVRIHQQVQRVVGEGLQRTATKEHDVRNLRLPAFLVEMLRRRLTTAQGPLVFPSERGGLLGPRQVLISWKKAFAGSEWDWVTPKTLRKTVATLVDAEHGSVLASKQLGHASDGVTRRHYIAPSGVPIDSGSVLELFEVLELEA
ncbi:tyrosine-type recombinase/integrase [Arthrobacter sp. 2RAF6]|uniref:tyrosine-type recombinase/integrase n=1 Tax=Arthrobacter sp. 2RAF6 TaxID=3233002 RepID=UPI003F8FC675